MTVQQQPDLQQNYQTQQIVPAVAQNYQAPVVQNNDQGMMRNLSNAIYNLNQQIDYYNTNSNTQNLVNQSSPRQMVVVPQQSLLNQQPVVQYAAPETQQPQQYYTTDQSSLIQQQSQPIRQAQIMPQPQQYYTADQASLNQQQSQPVRQAQMVPQQQYYQVAQPNQQAIQPQVQVVQPAQPVNQIRRDTLATAPQAVPNRLYGGRIFPGVAQRSSPARTATQINSGTQTNLVVGNRIFPTVANSQNGASMSVIGH